MESIKIAKKQADQRRLAKIHQKELREEEEVKKPLVRPGGKRSDELVRKGKYGGIKVEDRLLNLQADALSKYAGGDAADNDG